MTVDSNQIGEEALLLKMQWEATLSNAVALQAKEEVGATLSLVPHEAKVILIVAADGPHNWRGSW